MTSNTLATPFNLGVSFIRSGFTMLILGFFMSFGMVGHYIVGARYPTGDLFLKNISLWFACPWTLSTSVVLLGSVGMITIGCAYVALGRSANGTHTEGSQRLALAICRWSLISIFLTGYAGYFVVDAIWPSFFYSPLAAPKNLWLLLQLGCMMAYLLAVTFTSAGIRRLIRDLA